MADNNGKQWSPVDIKNLEEANKLLDELNKKYDRLKRIETQSHNPTGNSTMDARNRQYIINHQKEMNKLEKEIAAIEKRRDELGDKELARTNKRIEAEKKLKEIKQENLNITKEQNKEEEKAQKNQKKWIDNLDRWADSQRSDYNGSNESFSLSNAGSFFTSKARNKARTNAFNQAFNELKGSANQFENSGEFYSAVNKKADKLFNDSVKRLNLAADTLQVGANLIKDTFSRLKQLIFSGVNDQRDTYNNTFHDISVRTGITKDNYFTNQLSVDKQLDRLGLADNILVSEVQEMWSSLAKTGMNSEDMFANALDNVITQKIVPYLDVTSTSVNLLNNRLDGNFIKQIRGINAANLDIAGNNYVTQELLNKIIDQVQPMSDVALQDLVKGSEELSSLLNTLMSKDGGNMSYDSAMKIATHVLQGKNYSSSLFNSGNMLDILSWVNATQQGLNYNNAGDFGKLGANYASTGQFLLSTTAGYGDNISSMQTNTVADIVGAGADLAHDLLKLNDKGLNAWDLLTNISANELQNYEKEATSDLEKNKNDTAKTLQNVTLANLMTELAVFEEWTGNPGELVVDAITDLGKILIGYIGANIVGGGIGKGIGALAGTAGGGTGAGLLGGASLGSSVAFGAVAAPAAILAIGSAVADAMWSASGEHGAKKAEETLAGTTLEQNSAAQSMLATTYAQQDSGGFQKLFGNVGAGISMAFSNIFQGKADKNKNFLQWAIQSGAIDTGDQSTNNGNFLALAAIYAQNNYLDAFNKGLQEAGIPSTINSKEDIGKLIRELGVTKETLNAYAANMIKAGWGKINLENGGTLQSFDIDGSQFGLKDVLGYRQGLDSVPYDNYVAALHEGEAVLTASTANELRNLLVEYRDSNQMAVNFEAAIQSQTIELCSKLDDVISVLRSGNNITSARWNDNVMNNMRYVRSTKSFN